jgi:hypothetical protein
MKFRPVSRRLNQWIRPTSITRQWLCRGLRDPAEQLVLRAELEDREAPESVARQLSSLVAERGRGLGMRPRRASRMVRAWSKSSKSTSLARLCSPSFPDRHYRKIGPTNRDQWPAAVGSTTRTNGTPCRRTVRRRGAVCPRAPVTGAGSGRDCRTASTTGNPCFGFGTPTHR